MTSKEKQNGSDPIVIDHPKQDPEQEGKTGDHQDETTGSGLVHLLVCVFLVLSLLALIWFVFFRKNEEQPLSEAAPVMSPAQINPEQLDASLTRILALLREQQRNQQHLLMRLDELDAWMRDQAQSVPPLPPMPQETGRLEDVRNVESPDEPDDGAQVASSPLFIDISGQTALPALILQALRPLYYHYDLMWGIRSGNVTDTSLHALSQLYPEIPVPREWRDGGTLSNFTELSATFEEAASLLLEARRKSFLPEEISSFLRIERTSDRGQDQALQLEQIRIALRRQDLALAVALIDRLPADSHLRFERFLQMARKRLSILAYSRAIEEKILAALPIEQPSEATPSLGENSEPARKGSDASAAD